jgi:hypothetical protein
MNIIKNLLSNTTPQLNSVLIASMIKADMNHQEVLDVIKNNHCYCFQNIKLSTESKSQFAKTEKESINIFYEILKTNSESFINEFLKIEPYYNHVAMLFMDNLNQHNILIDLIEKNCLESFKALNEHAILTNLFNSNQFSPINKKLTKEAVYLNASDEVLDIFLTIIDEPNYLQKAKYFLMRENQQYFMNFNKDIYYTHPVYVTSKPVNLFTQDTPDTDKIYLSTTLLLDEKDFNLYDKLMNYLTLEEKKEQINHNINYIRAILEESIVQIEHLNKALSYIEKQKLELNIIAQDNEKKERLKI